MNDLENEFPVITAVESKRSTTPLKSRGKQCCVYNCYNYQLKTNGGEKSGLHFFRIHKAVLSAKRSVDRWCSLIKRQDGRDDFSMNSHTVICEEHFKKEQIAISTVSKKWTLKTGVEPCLFEWKNIPTPRKSPTKRLSLTTVTQSLREQEKDEVINKGMRRTQTDGIVRRDMGTQTEGTDKSVTSVEESFHHGSDHNYGFVVEADSRKQIEGLQEKLKVLSQNIAELQDKISNFNENQFNIDKIKHDDAAMMFYTGFQNYDIFNSVFTYLESKATNLQYWRGKLKYDYKTYQISGGKPGQKRKLTLQEEFFMVMIRLKVGLFVRDISDRFDISVGQFSKIFTTWIHFLYCELPLLFPFPSQEKIRRTMPKSFSQYPTTRIILDCTEVFIEIPSSMTAQSQTWSNYKHHNTYKVLVGISPNGCLTFVSDLWGGRVSDKEITRQSGILNLLEKGDNIMADRGFDIGDMLPEGVTLNIPPFKLQAKQLTANQVEETMNIASIRIHVERQIGRIKNYHILDGVIPLSLRHISNQIFTVVSYLTCFLPPLVSQD